MNTLLLDPVLQTCVVGMLITAGGAAATAYLWFRERGERHLLFWALTFAFAASRWAAHYSAEANESVRPVEAVLAALVMLFGAVASYEVLPARPWRRRNVVWVLGGILSLYIVASLVFHHTVEMGYSVYIGTLVFCVACLWRGYRSSGLSGYALAAAAFVCQAAFVFAGLIVLGPQVGNHVLSPLLTGGLIGSILLLTYQRTKRELVRSEQSIRESEERSRSILRASPDGIWIHRNGIVEYVNEALVRMLHYTDAGQFLGRRVYEFFPTQYHQVIKERISRVSDTLTPAAPVEMLVARSDGTTIAVETSASGTRERDGVRIIAIFRDITQRKQAQQARDQLATIVENSNDAIISRSLDGTIRTWNAAAERLFGYSASEAIGRPMTILVPGERHGDVLAHSKLLLGGGSVDNEEVQRIGKDGRRIDVTRSISPIKNEAGEITGASIIIRDISERKLAEKALQESEALFREFSENTPDVFWIRDADAGRIIYISPAWNRVTGYPVPKVLEDFLRIVHPDDIDRVRRALRDKPHGGLDHEYRIVRLGGVVRWLRVQSFALRDSDGRIYRVGAIAEDITGRKEDEQRLVKMAHYDHLTGLPNRTHFDHSLRRALDRASASGSTVGLFFIDLDRFKVVNDTLGHAAGDELLQKVSSRLVDSVRARDVVGRLGGDEFAIMAPNLDHLEDAGSIADKIITSFAAPFQLRGHEVFATASIGVTIFPNDATDAATLLRFADAAMYGAKEKGRNSYRYYTAELNARALERLDLENSLRRALERGEFRLHYQPKLEVATGRLTGVEALLRWQRPGVGLVPPESFIPILEDTGLILAVGEWVIQQACRQIKAWNAEGLGRVRVAVNLSPRQLHQSSLERAIRSAAQEHGIDPTHLQFELTESSLMSQDAVNVLKELRALGARVSVDDFGTGYSSLAYLKRFAIDEVKIDQAFVRDIATDPDDAAIVLAIITMAHALGLGVVAEGVENDEQLDFLQSKGCDEVQGFYVLRPVSDTDMSAAIRNQPWKTRPALARLQQRLKPSRARRAEPHQAR